MSLTESARDFVQGLVRQEPEVGEHDTTRGQRDLDDASAATGASSTPSTGDTDADDVERLRLEWETQPGHH